MRVRRLLKLFATVLAVWGLTACQPAGEDEPGTEPAADSLPAAPAEPGVVEVTAVDYAFRMPAEVPSGWTTFRLANGGAEPHFMVLWKLPAGKTLEDYVAEVMPAFVSAYDSIVAGTVDAAGAGALIGENLPEWFAEMKPMGGPGMLTPGRSVATAMELEPGTYVAECYVKTAGGEFHGELGMVTQFTVTDDSTGAAPPVADAEMTLTSTSIGIDGPVAAGQRTFAVHYEEHPPAGLGHDVHVARLDEGADLAALAAWMDWLNVEGFRDPAPVEFVGGVQEMPVGATSYFTVNLEPGRYAWVSEATTAERLVEAFTVE